MYLLSTTIILSFLPAFMSAKPLPACSDRDVACKCPNGTTFGNYTTTGTIGATANAVYGVTGDCKPSVNHSLALYINMQ